MSAGDASAGVTARAPTPSRPWAIAELIVAIALLNLGLNGYLPFAATPYMLVAAALFVWRRGPGWRAIGLRRPASWPRTIAIAAVLASSQLFSLYVLEPLIARLTSGELPDVSMFAGLVGNLRALAVWLAISWTVAAFVEEMVFRGWILTRIAEVGAYSRAAWWSALAGSSALFGAAHLYQGLSGVITTALVGAMFGAAYLLSGRNLWCAILAHGLTDTIGFTMIYFGVYPGL